MRIIKRLKATGSNFKSFIAKGNVMDLAIGVVIGTAFGKVISSIVDDLIMPIIGILSGKVNFTKWFFALDFKNYESIDAARAAKVAVITYGNLIQVGINFLLVGLALFIVSSLIHRSKEKASALTKECPECCSSIACKAKLCPYCQSRQPPESC